VYYYGYLSSAIAPVTVHGAAASGAVDAIAILIRGADFVCAQCFHIYSAIESQILLAIYVHFLSLGPD
jgi:hypothetical protein